MGAGSVHRTTAPCQRQHHNKSCQSIVMTEDADRTGFETRKKFAGSTSQAVYFPLRTKLMNKFGRIHTVPLPEQVLPLTSASAPPQEIENPLRISNQASAFVADGKYPCVVDHRCRSLGNNKK